MKKYIVIIIATILIGSSIQVAFGDWIDYLPWRMDSDPVLGVCVYEPEEDSLQGAGVADYLVSSSLMAVMQWESKLATYTNGTEYDMEFYYILKDTHMGKEVIEFSQCNVHIAFWEEKHKEAGDNTLGVTWSAGSILGKDMVMIEVYPKILSKVFIAPSGSTFTPEDIEKKSVIKQTWVPPDGIYSIVLHEFGHAIGIGHKCVEEYGAKFDSVMRPNIDQWGNQLNITDYDLGAVYQYYGSEGWDSEEKPFQMKYGGASKSFRGDVRCT